MRRILLWPLFLFAVRSDKVGAIEPGKFADVVAVDGNPLQDMTTLQNVKFVMKGGEVYKNEYAH